MEDKIKIEIGVELAYVIQRMIVDEINNQYEWIRQERKEFGKNEDHEKVRFDLIDALEKERKNLESQGLPIFHYYR